MSTPENTPEKNKNLDDLLPGELVSPEEARPIKRAKVRKEEEKELASTPIPDPDEQEQEVKTTPVAAKNEETGTDPKPEIKPKVVAATTADKPKFKVTRSPFTPKVGASDGGETPAVPSAKPAAAVAPAAKAAPSPITAKPTVRPSAPKTVRGHIPVEKDTKINPGILALDLIAAAVAITCAVIIFANLGA